MLRNPSVTPEYNFFLLEYNGEASLPFEGVNIWVGEPIANEVMFIGF